MAVELGREAPVEPDSSPPRLHWWVTGVALGVLVVLAVLIFWPSLPLDTLERPEQSLERLVTRDMDFRAASRAVPAWERRLYALAFSSGSEARAAAIDWYDELVEAEGSPLAELYRLILLAEDGQTEAVRSALAEWTPGDDWAGQLAAWARMAYGTELASPQALRSALVAVRRELPAGWFADRLAARLALRLGDLAAAAEAERRTMARGTRLLWRLRAILAGETVLVALGAVALAALDLGPWAPCGSRRPGADSAAVERGGGRRPLRARRGGSGGRGHPVAVHTGTPVVHPRRVGGLGDPAVGVPRLVLRLVVGEPRRGRSDSGFRGRRWGGSPGPPSRW